MRIAGTLVAVLFASIVSLAVGRTSAAGPGITITHPANGAMIQGTTLTVSVSVSHFRLVRPVFSHPPVLKGYAGSLQYILDSTANYDPRRDLSAATTHTWTGVTPGRHTVIVRLATSQHLPWPGGPVARVRIVVAAPPAPTRRHAGGASPGVGAAPTTGGGAGLTQSKLNLGLILLAALLIVLGFAVFGRRLVFATTAGRRSEAPASPSPDVPTQVLSVMPAPGENPDPGDEHDFSAGVFPAAEHDPPANPNETPAGHVPTQEPENPLPEPSSPDQQPPTASEPAAGEALPASSVAFESDPRPAPAPAQPASSASAIGVTPPHGEAGPTPAGEMLPRERAIELAREWSGVVESLVRQLDAQESERQRMLEHIRLLEDRIRGAQVAREQLKSTSGGSISPDDFQTLRYLTDALQRDPDHIVNLAAISQHATKFRALVDAYAQLRQALIDT